MTAEVTVPTGFVPYREPSPFLDRVGPIYERDDDQAWRLAFSCSTIIAIGGASLMAASLSH